MYSSVLQAEDVYKKFGNFNALDGFSCDIPAGIIGLLGPNGAGKTTFIKSLLGLHPFESGNINLMDGKFKLPKDFLKVKDFIGYMPEKETKINRLSAFKYVENFGKVSGLPRSIVKQRAFDVLHYVGLEEARYRTMETFSTGMIQRVKLATALVHDPEIIILDEPTAGLDPPGREQMLNLIKDLGETHGKNIIMSTHLLPDVERLSDYVVVINHGKQVMQGQLHKLLESRGDAVTLKLQVSEKPETFFNVLRENGYEASMVNQSEILCYLKNTSQESYIDFFRLAKGLGINIRLLTTSKASLEDIFLDAVHQNVRPENLEGGSE